MGEPRPATGNLPILKPASRGTQSGGRLELFITGIDGQGLGRVCHTWQDTPSGPWPRWWVHDGPQNGVQGAPAAGLNQDGRIEVFVIESGSHHLYSQPQTAPSNGWAPNWFTFGAPPGVALASSPGVGRNADGRLAVFAVGNDGILWTKDQISPNNGWSDWISLGAPILQAGVRWNSSPVAASNADGRLELFMLGTDSHLWHQWQNAPNSGQWAWESFGSPQGGARRIVGTPAVGSNADGRLEVFVVTDDRSWWHRWQRAPNSGWSGWDNSFLLGRAVGHGDLAVGSNADGRLQVFGSDGDLVHTWQDPGSDTAWFKGRVDKGPLGLGPPLPVSAPPDTLGSPGGDFPELLPWNWPVLNIVPVPPGGLHF